MASVSAKETWPQCVRFGEGVATVSLCLSEGGVAFMCLGEGGMASVCLGEGGVAILLPVSRMNEMLLLVS